MNRGRVASSPNARRRLRIACVSASSVTGTPRHTSSMKRSLDTSLPASAISNASASKLRPARSTGEPSIRDNRRSVASNMKLSNSILSNAIFHQNFMPRSWLSWARAIAA
jgi:pyruvate/2-oxoglutarate dehydrogenase complex dihydrolipoamide acyltransferase (E2) component